MLLLFAVLLAFVVATIGAALTYFYLDSKGDDDKKVKFAVMVFLIILFVILFVLYEGAVSVWVGKLLNSSAS